MKLNEFNAMYHIWQNTILRFLGPNVSIHAFSVLFALLWNLGAQAQDYVFEHYSDADGLSHNSVRSIVQDKHGFLWLGTFGGVNRFNGYSFKRYNSQINNPNYIQDDDITQLALDDQENLWIGTSHGLTRLHLPSSSFTTYLPDSDGAKGICGSKIRSLYIDKQKRVWIGTKFNGLCYYDEREGTFGKVELGDVSYVRAISQSENGRLWVGTYEKGVYSFDIDDEGTVTDLKNYPIRQVRAENGASHDVYFIYQDRKYDIFAGSRNGLFKLNKLDDRFEALPQKGGAYDFFRFVTRGPRGKYWLGTLNGIIECHFLEDIGQGKYKRHLPDPMNNYALANSYISTLFFDNSGVLWIGTENGLDKWDPFENQFKVIPGNAISNKAPTVVSSFGKTFDGNLLFGTHANGLYLSTDSEISLLSEEDLKVSSIYTLDGKTFYCGLWNGKILKYDYPSSKSELLDVGFGQVPIFAFCTVAPDKMLVGSNGNGLVELDTGSKKSRAVESGVLGGQDINKIVRSESGLIWLGTENGIYRYNRETSELKNYIPEKGTNSGLSNSKVKDLVIDKKGKIWAATRHGLNSYDADADDFRVEDRPADLKDLWITDIALDSSGCMWLNMNYNRMAKYRPDLGELRIFPIDNGVRSNIYNKRGFLVYNDSLIYMGGNNGIIYFSPPEIKENKWSPTPVITEFKVQNKEVVPGLEVNGQKILGKEDLNTAKKVSLNYRNRNFSLQFAAPSFVKERSNRYEYMLEGFDTDWIATTSSSRNVQYTNLYPGDYVFKVKAANSTGYWSSTATYGITVLPPFWLTYKALFLYLVLGTLIFYLVRKEIKNRLELKHELLLERVKRERDEKLNNEKLRFFTNISHELKTPLTLILGPAKQLIDEGEETGNAYQKSRSGLIHQNANRLLNLVNQILDFRNAQTGELKLKVSRTDILVYTRNTFQSFWELADDKNIHFNLSCSDDAIFGWIDADKYDKILYNLLSNAFKFTPRNGHVDLFVGLKDHTHDWLVVEVSDDGIGIPLHSQKKIFKRFYQAANSKANNTGTGIGLSLVKSLVKLHKGKIEVQSEPGKGSVFTIELPIKQKFYERSEIFQYLKAPSDYGSSQLLSAKKILRGVHLKEKILIVEDNGELRKYLVDYLSDYYKVYSAENGLEGLKLCREVKPATCVADIMMPEMNGFEFCEALKNDGSISHVPVILLTALSANRDMIKGFSTGADAYLVKPFDPSLLTVRIENMIKSRKELKAKFSDEVESEVSSLTHSPVDEEFMKKVTDLIEEDLAKADLSTAFLCRELGMSSSKLYRKIKELTDLAPNEFIRTIRLKRSAKLLKTKKYNVSEVTDLIGFNDPLYFSRCFKKQFGFPPSKLIR